MEAEKDSLVVVEAFARDIGHGIGRIDTKTMADLGLSKGDIIEIIGRRTTAVRCIPSTPEIDGYMMTPYAAIQENQHMPQTDRTIKDGMAYRKTIPHIPSTINIDGLTRNNAGIAIGDTVKIRKVDSKQAGKSNSDPA